MRFDELVLTDKWRDVLDDDSQVIFLEGPSQTSKTTLEAVKAIWDIFDKSEYGDTIIYLCGESTNTLYRNFVEKDTGITKMFPHMTRYVGDTRRGGERIEITVPYDIDGKRVYEVKKMYFVGYSTVASENKLLGNKPFMIICDEFNKAHESFVRQVFTRVASTGCKLLATSNGDVPEKLFYQYLNSCRPADKWAHDVPMSTINYMEEQKPKVGWVYYFFGLYDRPVAPEGLTMNEWVAQMKASHPEGSFSYNAYVLGIRGHTEGALYGHLFRPEHNVDEDDINYHAVIELIIGTDMGSAAIDLATSKNAHTVVIPVAYSQGYQRAVVLDSLEAKEFEHIKVVREIEAMIQRLRYMYGYKLRTIFVDSAENVFIETFRKNKLIDISIEKSIKSTKEVTAKSRVSLKEQLIIKNRLLFLNNEGAQRVRENLARVKGKNGEVIDENMKHNDYNDALDYALTPRMHRLTSVKVGIR